MKIEICIQCIGTDYAKRLNWMLSSIYQQEQLIVNDKIETNISLHQEDVNTLKIIDFFKNIIKIQTVEYNDYKMACNRNITRNTQVVMSNADWIIFADCDMVYDKLFFSDLFKQLKTPELKNEIRCISSNRISLNIAYCANMFNNIEINDYPLLVSEVANTCSKIPIKKTSSKVVGAGFFQLVRRARLKELGNVYTNKRRGEPLGFYTSDIIFRRRLSPINSKYDIKVIKTLPQYHLNHLRKRLMQN